MESLRIGARGATSLAWSNVSPREVLLRLRESNSSSSKEELLNLFADEAKADQSILDAIILYWFKNNYKSLTRIPRSPASLREMPAHRELVATVKEEIKDRAVKMVFLDMMLPHGKTLRDSTGQECSVLAPRIGKWLGEIGKIVGPHDKVGDTLTEDRAKELYGSI